MAQYIDLMRRDGEKDWTKRTDLLRLLAEIPDKARAEDLIETLFSSEDPATFIGATIARTAGTIRAERIWEGRPELMDAARSRLQSEAGFLKLASLLSGFQVLRPSGIAQDMLAVYHREIPDSLRMYIAGNIGRLGDPKPAVAVASEILANPSVALDGVHPTKPVLRGLEALVSKAPYCAADVASVVKTLAARDDIRDAEFRQAVEFLSRIHPDSLKEVENSLERSPARKSLFAAIFGGSPSMRK